MPSRPACYRPPGQPTARERDRQYDRARQADKNFYSSTRWRKFRAWVLAERPLCEDCLAASRVVTAEHVHHIQPRTTHPELAFEACNVRALCQPCHNAQEIR